MHLHTLWFVVVADTGRATAERLCAAVEGSEPGDPSIADLLLTLQGQIEDDRSFLGTMEQTGPDGAIEAFAMTGSFSTGGVGLFWSGLVLDQHGAETNFEGTIVLWGS